MKNTRIAGLAAFASMALAPVASIFEAGQQLDHHVRTGPPLSLRKGKSTHKQNARKAKKGK
jgi:hypothetical protein